MLCTFILIQKRKKFRLEKMSSTTAPFNAKIYMFHCVDDVYGRVFQAISALAPSRCLVLNLDLNRTKQFADYFGVKPVGGRSFISCMLDSSVEKPSELNVLCQENCLLKNCFVMQNAHSKDYSGRQYAESLLDIDRVLITE